jgi:hypothetical protein
MVNYEKDGQARTNTACSAVWVVRKVFRGGVAVDGRRYTHPDLRGRDGSKVRCRVSGRREVAVWDSCGQFLCRAGLPQVYGPMTSRNADGVLAG